MTTFYKNVLINKEVMKKGLIALNTAVLSAMAAVPAFADTNIVITPPPTVAKAANINDIVSFVITVLVVVGVIAALAFLIYGGIKWITSGGDKNAVESARNHIVAAIVGLVIIILSFVIIGFIFQILGITTGPGLPTLTIPTLRSS